MLKSLFSARIIATLVLAAGAAACRQDPVDEGNAFINAAAEPPRIVQPNPPLNRAGLLAAVAQAASAAAAGAAPSDELRALDGRQFEVRIRFGCRGPSAPEAEDWLSWSYDAETRTIRVRARPTISIDDPLVAKVAGPGFEAAEGFWLARPWLLQASCPASAAAQAAQDSSTETDDKADDAPTKAQPAPAENLPMAPRPILQRIGIAHFYTASDPRTGRRDNRPYQADHVLAEGQALGSTGFDIVLSGRLRAFPSRSAIECSVRDPESPPDCIVSADFQRVWIVQPDTGEVIADWGGG